MKLRQLLRVLIALFFAVTHLHCAAQESTIVMSHVTGTFSSLKYLRGPGDLVGVELLLMNSNEGPFIVFQSAEGGTASVPVVVRASIVGNQIEFTLPASTAYPGRFVGTVERSKIVGRFDEGYINPTQPGDVFVLPRRIGYWQR